MKYIIVEEKDMSDIEKEVNKKIKEGYKPLGGVAASCTQLGIPIYYTQAMIKED